MKEPTTMKDNEHFQLGPDLTIAAAALTLRTIVSAGSAHDALRKVFEDNINTLQRQAKRVALLTFDEAALRLAIEEAQSKP